MPLRQQGCSLAIWLNTSSHTFDEAEGALNEGLGCVQKLFAATATATSAMSIGNGDRTDTEQHQKQKALALLNKLINDEDRRGQYELVAVGSP